jgi:hypothetical protein
MRLRSFLVAAVLVLNVLISHRHTVCALRNPLKAVASVRLGSAATGSTTSSLRFPAGIAVDRDDTVYVADKANKRIVSIASGASVLTVLTSTTTEPVTVAVSNDGTYVLYDDRNPTDTTGGNNNAIYKHTVATGTSAIWAGSQSAYAGQTTGFGTSARFSSIKSILFDHASKYVYVASSGAYIVHRGLLSATPSVYFETWYTDASSRGPQALAITDKDTKLFVGFSSAIAVLAIPSVTTTSPTVSSVVGVSGTACTDGGSSVAVVAPSGLAVDKYDEYVFFADATCRRVRYVQLSNLVVRTVWGAGTLDTVNGATSNGASPLTANLGNAPTGVAFTRDNMKLFATGAHAISQLAWSIRTHTPTMTLSKSVVETESPSITASVSSSQTLTSSETFSPSDSNEGTLSGSDSSTLTLQLTETQTESGDSVTASASESQTFTQSELATASLSDDVTSTESSSTSRSASLTPDETSSKSLTDSSSQSHSRSIPPSASFTFSDSATDSDTYTGGGVGGTFTETSGWLTVSESESEDSPTVTITVTPPPTRTRTPTWTPTPSHSATLTKTLTPQVTLTPSGTDGSQTVTVTTTADDAITATTTITLPMNLTFIPLALDPDDPSHWRDIMAVSAAIPLSFACVWALALSVVFLGNPTFTA